MAVPIISITQLGTPKHLPFLFKQQNCYPAARQNAIVPPVQARARTTIIQAWEGKNQSLFRQYTGYLDLAKWNLNRFSYNTNRGSSGLVLRCPRENHAKKLCELLLRNTKKKNGTNRYIITKNLKRCRDDTIVYRVCTHTVAADNSALLHITIPIAATYNLPKISIGMVMYWGGVVVCYHHLVRALYILLISSMK